MPSGISREFSRWLAAALADQRVNITSEQIDRAMSKMMREYERALSEDRRKRRKRRKEKK